MRYASRLQNPSLRPVDAQDHARRCLVMRRGARDGRRSDLGGDVVKKRVALPGRGKSGSVRTLVATRKASRWFFVFGFEKNERANVTANELEALQMLASDLLALSGPQLDQAVEDGALQEICHAC